MVNLFLRQNINCEEENFSHSGYRGKRNLIFNFNVMFTKTKHRDSWCCVFYIKKCFWRKWCQFQGFVVLIFFPIEKKNVYTYHCCFDYLSARFKCRLYLNSPQEEFTSFGKKRAYIPCAQSDFFYTVQNTKQIFPNFPWNPCHSAV